jgi:hypothetical protein
VPARDKSFSGRLLTPQPLPDDEPSARDPARESKPLTAAERPVANSPPAARTIRLHASAAEPLNEAWLNERRTRDPKLSYPEFASMIVRLGLAAYEKGQRDSAT